MDRDIDRAIQQRLFDLAREQALAADFLQRLVEDLVPRHLDHHDLEGILGQGKGRHQAAARLVRLPEGQRRAAGADLQGGVGGGKRVCHAHSLTCVNFA